MEKGFLRGKRRFYGEEVQFYGEKVEFLQDFYGWEKRLITRET